MRLMILAAIAAVHAAAAAAQTIAPRQGWQILATDKSYEALVSDVIAAVGVNGLAVVTQAGPTGAAAARGITIPGNRVIGVFNNAFAVRILALSTAAMIEAPLRFYVTEGADGSATLAWKEPSFVFAPYFDEGGAALRAAAAELDARFQAIGTAAAGDGP